jgi:hypothetical protein
MKKNENETFLDNLKFIGGMVSLFGLSEPIVKDGDDKSIIFEWRNEELKIIFDLELDSRGQTKITVKTLNATIERYIDLERYRNSFIQKFGETLKLYDGKLNNG